MVNRKEYLAKYYRDNKQRLIPVQKEYYYRQKECNPVHILYIRLKSRAKKKGVDFTIEESDLVIPEMCPFLGISLYFTKGRQTNNTPSVDRRDNSKGYIKGNVAVMSNKANSMKNSLNKELIQKFLKYMETGEVP